MASLGQRGGSLNAQYRDRRCCEEVIIYTDDGNEKQEGPGVDTKQVVVVGRGFEMEQGTF